MHPEIPVLSFISAALALVSVTWYLEAHNIAAFAIGIWLSIIDIIYAVDVLVWAQDVDIKASVWCDISTSLLTSSRIALPAACLCICIHLERLASFSQSSPALEKRQRILFECVICFGLPVVYTALHLIVQPVRFNLVYGFGCRPATSPTVASVFLVLMPPLLLALVTIYFAVLAWRHFLVHGVQFSGKRSSTSSHTRSLYVRLVGMALLETTFAVILMAVTMWPVLSAGLIPLSDMSRNLSLVAVWGRDAVPYALRVALEIEWSGTVVQSVVFFGLFASRMEVLREGWQVIRSLLDVFRRQKANPWIKQAASLRSSTGTSEPAGPVKMIDLTLAAVTQSTSTITRDGHSPAKSLLPTPIPSRPLSSIEDVSEELVITDLDPASLPLDSPSRSSAIPSSHNSLESNFDPRQLVLPEEWPRPSPSTPAVHMHGHVGRWSSSMGYTPKHNSRPGLDIEAAFSESPMHVRSCASDAGVIPGGGWEIRETIYVAVPNRTPR